MVKGRLRAVVLPLLVVPALLLVLLPGPLRGTETGVPGSVEWTASETRKPARGDESGVRSPSGAITGRVRFAGEMPRLKPIRVSRDHAFCGLYLPEESYLIGPERGLKNVVVYLNGFPDKLLPPAEAGTRFLTSHNCLFSPRIMAMRWGDRLVLKNDDPKLHIGHAYAARRTVFNVALPFQGNTLATTHKIKKPELLQVHCDTHAWMRAYIHVFGHPYFAVTDESGAFTITGVPPGSYTLTAWHERAGVQTVEVLVPENGETKVRLQFREPGAS